MTQLTPKTQEALSHVQLFPGEEIQYAVQADGFFLGTNPLAKAMAKVQAFFTKITGGHIRMFLVITNQRLLLIESTATCCGFTASRIVHTISTRSIVEAGTVRETTWCCFHTRMIAVESLTQKYMLVAKSMSDQELMEFITRMSMLIIQNVAR